MYCCFLFRILKAGGLHVTIRIKEQPLDHTHFPLHHYKGEETCISDKKFEDLTISDDFMYQLDKGMDYMQLKQSFVIFVCTFDPFQLGRHIYTFTNRCVEDPDLLLNDGTQKIILNTKGIFDDVRPELKRLLNFIDGRQPEDAFTQDLSEAVESAKRNEKWRLDYMTLQMAYDEKYREGLEAGIQRGVEQGIEQGIEQGVAQGIENTARRMLASTKYSDAEISEITGLSMAQIQTLKESL